MIVCIDPGPRTITEFPSFPLPDIPLIEVRGLGLVCHQPMSPFAAGIRPFYFEPLGLLMGRVFIVDPQQPVEPLVTWVNTTMIINGATLIIPIRPTVPDRASG